MDYCISLLHLPLHLSLTHYCIEDTNCRVRSHKMEGKQRRMSYDATSKRKVYLYAEKNGNRKAGREFNVAESNVRLWRQQKLALFATKARRKKFIGPRKGRHPKIEGNFGICT